MRIGVVDARSSPPARGRGGVFKRMRDVVKRISRSPPRARAAAAAAPPRQALALDAALDLNAAGQLRAALLALRGADLALDASAVHHLGAQCAQVLASAAATWAADGAALTIPVASEPFAHSLRLLGLQSILIPESIQA